MAPITPEGPGRQHPTFVSIDTKVQSTNTFV